VYRQSQATVNKHQTVPPAKTSSTASAHRSPSHPQMGNQAAQRLLGERVIQAKLTVNQPGDSFEQEADRMADAVMRMSEPRNARGTEVSGSTAVPCLQRMCSECQQELQSSPAPIQRLCSECGEELKRQPTLQAKGTPGNTPEVTPAIASRIQSLQGGGQPLPVSVRNFFELRFGQDFSHVRVHTDVASTRSLQARAYTVGRNIVFGSGQYSPDTSEGKRLLAHELTHVVQQEGAVSQPMQSEGTRPSTAFQRTREPASSRVSDVIQRAGDPAAIPPTLRCPTDLTPGRPAGTDLMFGTGARSITPAHTALLTTFRATWLAAGGTDDIIVHGYASTLGDQGPNWTLSCDRAEAVQAELVRLGIPAVRISVVAHGESTDFGAGMATNQRAVVTTRAAGPLPLPLVGGLLTARDNFPGRSGTRFGVGEVIDLSFFSLPPRPAADFGGLQWVLVSGGGTLVPGLVPNDGTATYTAPATASAVRLELRVATGATAGRAISSHAITIVIPSGVRMTAVPGTAPNFGGFGAPLIPAGTWRAGFQANVFIDPRDVSFQGVVFGEGTVAAVVTPAGSFLSTFAGLVHPANTFGPGHAGNATTGTPVSPPPDGIFSGSRGPARTVPLIGPICGASDFLWAIPWEFSVAGGPRTRFATANHHATSAFFCNATIEKGGAGPFCRRINGTTC
jgi:outer membrane protein OmpA-like peptidoglycan-associated protein